MATRRLTNIPPAEPAAPIAGAIRVMLVDDSLVVRSIIERIISDAGGFDVCASVPTAAEALRYLAQSRVDVIVLDIEMPGMTGIDALPHILNESGGARVLILSSNCVEGGSATIEALARGASDTLAKPGRGSFAGSFSAILVQRLRILGGDDRVPLRAARGEPSPASVARSPMPVVATTIDCIAVAASTGGIPAFASFLANLDARISAPILLTQHLPNAFISYYAQQIAQSSKREVVVAAAGMRLKPRVIYLAPGDAHMALAKIGRHVEIVLDRHKAASGCCPSADPMFAAVAAVYGARAVGVVLSGMGRDGADGATLLRDAGGTVLAQAPESCVVWGMPGAVAKAGIAAAVLNPDAMAVLLGRFAPSTGPRR